MDCQIILKSKSFSNIYGTINILILNNKKLQIYLLLAILLINIVDQMGLLFLQFLR